MISFVNIVNRHVKTALHSVNIFTFRPTQNGASATLGQADWLDGFTETNRTGLFLALCLKDNNILILKWKDEPG